MYKINAMERLVKIPCLNCYLKYLYLIDDVIIRFYALTGNKLQSETEELFFVRTKERIYHSLRTFVTRTDWSDCVLCILDQENAFVSLFSHLQNATPSSTLVVVLSLSIQNS
jgi:hypothetical protein